MQKLIIVINGKGGAGKDTLIDLASSEFKIANISSITPIKEAAKVIGWDGQKDEKSRKFLADLKKLSTTYNDYPTTYLVEQCKAFMQSENDLAFICIREPNEIEKFKGILEYDCKTLLIKRPEQEGKVYGNDSDDNTEQYIYDYTFNNNKPLNEIGTEFISFLYNMIKE